MVRNTGSVMEEHSLRSPTGELLSSVVRRSNGNSAKRKSGTASSAPTNTDPTPSSTTRNDRRSSSEVPATPGLHGVVSGSAADSHIELSPANKEKQRYYVLMDPTPRHFPSPTTPPLRSHLL